jgi:hypothetical protein
MGAASAPGAQYEPATSETEPTDGRSILVLTFSLPWEFDPRVAAALTLFRMASSAVLRLSQPAQYQG